jgi:hypothetical protein
MQIANFVPQLTFALGALINTLWIMVDALNARIQLIA